MLNSLYRVLSVGLKYWFLLLAAVLAGILVVASRREYRERKALLGRIGQYVGYLEILRGLPQAQGVRIGIARENTVGSGKGADIILRHPSVQRAHALLYMQNGELVLSPLSRGVTKINGRHANNAYTVHTGDHIAFGEVEVRVFVRPELEGGEV